MPTAARQIRLSRKRPLTANLLSDNASK